MAQWEDAPKLSLDEKMALNDKALNAPKGFTKAQLTVESNLDPEAVSDRGARGIAQVIPSTANAWSQITGKKYDPTNEDDALELHRLTMQQNLQKFGNLADAARAYNGGWDKSKWTNAETSAYVPKIVAKLGPNSSLSVADPKTPQWEDAPHGAPGSSNNTASSTKWEDAPKEDTTPKFESKNYLDDIDPSYLKDFAVDSVKNYDYKKMIPLLNRPDAGTGAAAADLIGGIPGFVAGIGRGVYKGISEGDASKGLKAFEETSNKYMPSTLLKGTALELPTNSEGYKEVMKPFGAVSDIMGVAGQGYGELAKALGGSDELARQVRDASKLGMNALMVGDMAHGTFKGKKGSAEDAANSLKKLSELDVPRNEAPTSQTQAHADDFSAMNPYDVGNHVSELEAGRPTVLDSQQPDLFGGQREEGVPSNIDTPYLDSTTPKGNEIPYELSLGDIGAKEQRLGGITPDIPDVPDRLSLEEIQKTTDHDYQEVQASGDKSLMNPTDTQTLLSTLRSGNVGAALSTILRGHDSPIYRALADYLIPKVSDLKVRVLEDSVIKNGDRSYTGYYDPVKDEIVLSGQGAVSPHTVLHEVAHAMTSQFLRTKPTSVLSRGITNLFNQLKVKDGFDNFTGIINDREFVAEAFSNPEFQKWLKNQQVTNTGALRTGWSKFKDFVKNIIGVNKPDMVNGLEHTLDLSKQIVDASSDSSFRKAAQDQLKAAGVPKAIADFMEVPNNKTSIQPTDAWKNIPGLKKVADTFSFDYKSPEEVINLAKTADDIKKSPVGEQLRSGGLFASARSNNPVVRYTFSRIDTAVHAYENLIKEKLTGKTGLVPKIRELSPQEQGEIHSRMMLDEGQRVLTNDQLSQLGFNEKQIGLYQHIRQLSGEFFKSLNEYRISTGMEPMEERIAHLAGRFVGDFSHNIMGDKVNAVTGKTERGIFGRISANTKWELAKIRKFIETNHPEWEIQPREYNSLGKKNNPVDRMSGYMEALNFMGKNDPNMKSLLDTLTDYNKSDATKYLNHVRHAKEKQVQAGGIIGSEGHKSWLNTIENAKQGFKAQTDYYASGFKWVEMNKALEDVRKVTSDETVAKQNPNALEWSQKYVDHATNRNQGFVADAANALISAIGESTGIGHTKLLNFNNTVKDLTLKKFMAFGNIPFTVQHLMIPFQQMPAMAAWLKHVGIESGMATAQLKSLSTYSHYLFDGKESSLSPFEKQAIDYAHENNVFNVHLADTSAEVNKSNFRKKVDFVGGLDFTGPEHALRGNAFFFYAHLLHDAGMPVEKALNSAEHMTKFTLTDYSSHEAPMIWKKGAWLGQVAGTLTRYKINNLSQLEFYAREGMQAAKEEPAIRKVTGNLPLMTHLAGTLAFGGVMGFYAFKEVDDLYAAFSKYILKNPDNLSNIVLKSKLPEMLKTGVFSGLGVDMHTHFNESEMIPSLIPYGSANLDMFKSAFNMAYNHDALSVKQTGIAFAPQSLRGVAENQMFTEPKATTGANAGKSLYVNPQAFSPNAGKGIYARSDNEMALRNFGFRSTQESNERANNYAESRIQEDKKWVAEHYAEQANRASWNKSLTPEQANTLARQAASAGMSPEEFVKSRIEFEKNHGLSQFQQKQLKDSSGSLRGIQDLQQKQRR